ncbi:hypothetical protein FI667_g15836, partial [Globisporangium splendens]
MKGEWSRQTAMLEKDLVHAREALAESRECNAALQKEHSELHTHCHQVETTLAGSRTKEQLICGSRDAERAQFQKECDDLQATLASQRAKLEQTRQHLTTLEQHTHKSDIEKQELETKLAMTTRFHHEAGTKWRQRKEELQTRVAQLKRAVKTLRTQTQELQRDDELSRLLFPHQKSKCSDRK